MTNRRIPVFAAHAFIMTITTFTFISASQAEKQPVIQAPNLKTWSTYDILAEQADGLVGPMVRQALKSHDINRESLRQLVKIKASHYPDHPEWRKLYKKLQSGILLQIELYMIATKIIEETEKMDHAAPDYEHDMVVCNFHTPRYKLGCTMPKKIKIRSNKIAGPRSFRSRERIETPEPETGQTSSNYDLFRGWVPHLIFEGYWNDEETCWPGQLTHNNLKIYAGDTELGHLKAGFAHYKFSLKDTSEKDMWTERFPDGFTRFVTHLKIADTSVDLLPPKTTPINSQCGVWVKNISIGYDLENVAYDMRIARTLVSEKLENMGLRMVLHGHYSRRRSASTCLIHSLGERYLSRTKQGESNESHSNSCANTNGLVKGSAFHEEMMLNSAIKQAQELGVFDKKMGLNHGIQSYLQIRDVLNQECSTFTHNPISDFTTGESWIRNLVQWRGNNDALTENLIAFNQTYFDILELQRYGKSLMDGTAELSESERVKFNTEQNLSWLYSTPPTIEEIINE